MNVLLTCAGRRNYLVGYFRSALAGRGSVLAADASARAPAMIEADRAFVVPRVTEPDYPDRLLEICAKHAVKLVVPLNDLELPVLAAQRERFAALGTRLVVSAPHVIDVCFDKWATYRFLKDRGLPGPRTFVTVAEAAAALERGELDVPLVVKPRWGSASIGILEVEAATELASAHRQIQRQLARTILAGPSRQEPERAVIVQERLTGTEHGLDVVNDLDGRYVATFARRKLAMRAGETDAAVTVESEELAGLGARIGEGLRHVGNLDGDVFLTPGGAKILELNPRFGGGYPFSHVAGADLPAALLAWAAGERPDPSWLRVKPDVLAAKCDRLVVEPAHPVETRS